MRKYRFNNPKSWKTKFGLYFAALQGLIVWHWLGYSYFTDKARKKDPNYDNLSRVEKSLLLAGYDKNKVEMKEVNISLSGITVEKQSIDEYVEKRKQQKQLLETKEQPIGTKDC